ncbi:hypothetical protein BDR26DRAFT_856293 [Obelidium mucronatum]|nr:hypothetical protein BDR26DRAFT_856293 [Obelidium mucronatum]
MRIVEPVGSASSLVTNLFTANNLAHAIDAPLATLLLCPILLDTVNLDPAAGRLTPQDAEASSFLISVIQRDDPGFSASSLFEALQRAKFDTSSLTCLEMLRKDYKQTSCGRGVIGHKIELGISSVGASWDNLTAREDCANNSGKAVEVIRDFMESKKLEVFVIMTAFETCGIFKREMIVFSSLNKPKLFRGLMDDTEIQLSDQNPSLYKPFLKSHEDMQLYDVGNLKMSRKIFQPILVRIITSLA